jgi:hypothetical protein
MSSINWLTAALNGRLGNVVGSSWRGKDYTKMYRAPTNRNTTAQKGVRSVFAHVGHIAHKIYKGVLEPYTYPVPRELTKYNLMMKINDELYTDKVWAPAKLKIFAGELQAAPVKSAVYNVSAGGIIVKWDLGPGEDELDYAIAILYYETGEEALYSICTRGDLSMLIDPAALGASLDLTKMHVYLTFSQPPGDNYEHGQTSNTTYAQVTAQP